MKWYLVNFKELADDGHPTGRELQSVLSESMLTGLEFNVPSFLELVNSPPPPKPTTETKT